MKNHGLWSPDSIIKDECFTKSELELFYAIDGEDDKNLYIQQCLKNKGYDAIIYKNEVEGNGHDSFIVFNDNQVIPLPEKIKIPKLQSNIEFA